MASLIDFDREYMKYAAKMLQGKTEFKDDELAGLLNEAMTGWLNTPLDALDGKTPDGYFADMQPEVLADMLKEYCAAGMDVPEPLYRRISGEKACAAYLKKILADADAPEAARATAIRLICDMGDEDTDRICAGVLAAGGEISETAADRLKSAGYHVVELLSDMYEAAGGEGKAIILDVLSCYPGIDSTAERLIERLYNDRDRRAYYAILAGKLGDERLLEPLMRMSQLTDMDYYDYKEIINAIDALGGDPGDVREFYGDPDYEALRVADTMPGDEEN